MSYPFNQLAPSILVEVGLRGPAGYATATLVLDTGATRTMISRDLVVKLGYDLSSITEFSRVITVSGRETAPVVNIHTVQALGQERQDLPISCHNLPSGTPVVGLLGLDFFRGQRLTLDFREGLITLD